MISFNKKCRESEGIEGIGNDVRDKEMIRIKNLKKKYGNLEVLKGISTEVKEGEVISVIGPSGSGKSTFLRCINRLEEPTSGEIRINGKNILERGADINKIREEVGMVFQHFNLYPHKTVLENITLGPIRLKKISKPEAEKLAINAIKFALLKPARSTDITIDLDDAISIEGDSGIYILYTIARINTLLDKGKELGYTNNLSELKNISFNENEKSLITLLDYYPEYVKNALNNYMPNVLCEYLIELAHAFNALYAKERFVSEDKNETIKKLAVASAIKQTMTNASKLLGLTPVDRI